MRKKEKNAKASPGEDIERTCLPFGRRQMMNGISKVNLKIRLFKVQIVTVHAQSHFVISKLGFRRFTSNFLILCLLRVNKKNHHQRKTTGTLNIFPVTSLYFRNDAREIYKSSRKPKFAKLLTCEAAWDDTGLWETSTFLINYRKLPLNLLQRCI